MKKSYTYILFRVEWMSPEETYMHLESTGKGLDFIFFFYNLFLRVYENIS